MRRCPPLLAAFLAACTTTPPPRPVPPSVAVADRPKLLLRLGDDMRRAGDPGGAADLYRAAARALPGDAAPLLRLGTALDEAGDPVRGEAAFRAALVASPGNTEARRGLATALLAQGDAAGALSWFESLDDGTDPRALRAHGAALDLLNRHAEAQALYRRGLRLAPADAGLHGNLALSLALTGEADAAMDALRLALAAPEPDPRQEGNAVLVLALLGRVNEARARGAATIGPDATAVLLARAAAARAQGSAAPLGLQSGPAGGRGALPPVSGPLPPVARPPAADSPLAR